MDQKLFRRVTVTDIRAEQEALETLALLSKSKFDTVLEEYWQEESIDRQVQAAVADAFEAPSGRLVRLIRDVTGLKPSEVRKSLQRGNVIIDFPPLPAPGVAVREETQKPGPEPPAEKPSLRGVKVSDLVDAGLVKPGDHWRFQSGQTEAHLEVAPDGSLVIDGEKHSSPSAAGRAVTGWGSFDGWKHCEVSGQSGGVEVGQRVESAGSSLDSSPT